MALTAMVRTLDVILKEMGRCQGMLERAAPQCDLQSERVTVATVWKVKMGTLLGGPCIYLRER